MIYDLYQIHHEISRFHLDQKKIVNFFRNIYPKNLENLSKSRCLVKKWLKITWILICVSRRWIQVFLTQIHQEVLTRIDMNEPQYFDLGAGAPGPRLQRFHQKMLGFWRRYNGNIMDMGYHGILMQYYWMIYSVVIRRFAMENQQFLIAKSSYII